MSDENSKKLPNLAYLTDEEIQSLFGKTTKEANSLISAYLSNGKSRVAWTREARNKYMHIYDFDLVLEHNLKQVLISAKENASITIKAEDVHPVPTQLPIASPPRLLEKFLWLTLPAGLRDALLGDAEEAFNATLPKYGLRAARWDYFKEVVFGVGGAILMLYAQLQGKFKQRQ